MDNKIFAHDNKAFPLLFHQKVWKGFYCHALLFGFDMYRYPLRLPHYNIIPIMLFADTAGIGFYIISRMFSILRLCSAPVVIM